MELEHVVVRLAEHVERRYFGKYRAFVIDNEDSEQLGRLKLTVPSVLGDKVVTGWAMPCVPYGGDAGQGFLFIPEVGAGVWVEFEEGDLEFPIWVGTFWSKPGGESELPKPNLDGAEQDRIQNPPTRKIIKTKKGHTLQFEDADGEELITLVEATNGHVITLNQDGIQITDGANSHEIVLNGDGIQITDGANRHAVILNGSGVTIESAGDVNIKGQNINIEAQGDLSAVGKQILLNP